MNPPQWFVALIMVFCVAETTHLQVVSAQEVAGAVAIVVHPETAVEEVSFTELRRIFRGEQQFWPEGFRITLLVRAPVASERDVVLNRIYRMTQDEYRQYWIAKVLRAEVAAGPKIVYSTNMARGLVSAIPGAITFMPANEVDSGVKLAPRRWGSSRRPRVSSELAGSRVTRGEGSLFIGRVRLTGCRHPPARGPR